MTEHLIGTGFTQRIEGMVFDPSRDYRACLICGDVFQSSLDRAPYPTDRIRNTAKKLRDNWAKKHARSHTQKEHAMLKASGMTMTPEAAHKLAAYGLIPVSDMAKFDSEITAALAESHPVPSADAETD
jgi:hypothetical protein